jgi:hypothetical protein
VGERDERNESSWGPMWHGLLLYYIDTASRRRANLPVFNLRNCVRKIAPKNCAQKLRGAAAKTRVALRNA